MVILDRPILETFPEPIFWKVHYTSSVKLIATKERHTSTSLSTIRNRLKHSVSDQRIRPLLATCHHHHHHHNGLAMAPLNWSSAAPYKVCLVKIIN